MFQAATILYIYVETPLHAGTGRGLGPVDLPIQREVVAGYPLVQASTLKGRLRAEARRRLSAEELKALFGPDTEQNPSEHAGAVSPGDARLLLFPVRSLAGVFAWATSRHVLARFRRDARLAGVDVGWDLPEEPSAGSALVAGEVLVAGGRVVLEEFAFQPVRAEGARQIGAWVGAHCLPRGEEYRYWREALPERLVVLPEEAFRDFTLLSTEVTTRVRLNHDTKTVEEGALWTEEALPADTLLYAPLLATPTRSQNGVKMAGPDVLKRLAEVNPTRMQLGGDETIGKGLVHLGFGPIAAL